MKLLAGLIAAAGLTLAAVIAYFPLIEEANDTAGPRSIKTVVEAAEIEHLLWGTPWPDALDVSAAGLRDGADNITVAGTTVTWQVDDACFTADVPTPDSRVDVVSCIAPE